MSETNGPASLRPVKRPSAAFDGSIGGFDPADVSRVAHESATLLLHRARQDASTDIPERVNALVDEHGIDTLAELWAHSHPHSIPGALWRVYLLRAAIVQQSEETALAFERGRAHSPGIDPVVAGVVTPVGPAEVRQLADELLRGLYSGDVADAFERAAAFARVASVGSVDLAHDSETAEPERAARITRRADRLARIGAELTVCARRWRAGTLD